MDKGLYEIEGEKIDILEEDWDYLLILDACRYDYFKKTYSSYLDGKLKKAISPATTTMEWLNKVFNERYEDITYISSNPYVNSKVETKDQYGYNYDGKKHFPRIIDLWNNAWNEDLRTVEPEEVTKTALRETKFDYNRMVLHYMQPHAPYIGLRYRKYINKSEKDYTKNSNKEKNFKQKLASMITKILGIRWTWRIASLFDVKAAPRTLIGMEEGVEGIRNAYEENLELVLKSVKKFIDNTEPGKKIIITSDHGEFLGEDGIYGHGDTKARKPPIVEVPWLEINKE